MEVGYEPGNVSDKIKHSNLECLVENTPGISIYVEFHSGEGKYGEYEGSAIRVIKKLSQRERLYKAFLHEIRPKAREQLKENMAQFHDVIVLGDYNDRLVDYIKIADEKHLFLLDPTMIDDYLGRRGLLRALNPIILAGASVFMYVPQWANEAGHANVVTRIYDAIIRNHARGIDLLHPVFALNQHKRTDHNIIVATPSAFPNLSRHHVGLCSELFTPQELHHQVLVRTIAH